MAETEERILVDMYKANINEVEYTKHIKIVIELGKKIMESLGPDNILFLEYERAVCMAKGLRIEGAYNTGVENGKPDKCLTCLNPCPTKCPTEHSHS